MMTRPRYRRAMSDLDDSFAAAQARIKPITGLGTDVQLALYGLWKQATVGDVTGARPGMLDLRGRAKHDAWAARRGTARADAQAAYVALVDRHAR